MSMRATRAAYPLPGLLAIALLCAACADSDTADRNFSAAGSWFTDITEESGLDFRHEGTATEQLHMPAIMGGGVAFLDYDNDGDLDIYLSNSGEVLPGPNDRDIGKNRLFRRDADGRYYDVTSGSGLGDPGYGMGVATGDIDNDGLVDVFVSNYGPDRLFHNQGDGSFADISASAGAGVGGWSASAAFCDFDRDGFLDLYVTRYVDYLPQKPCTGKAGGRDFCGPKSFRPVHDVVLRNNGPDENGEITFSDVSVTSGVSSASGSGLGVVCFDADGDGWQDVYVANDADPNQFWINQGADAPGGIAFRDDSLLMGVAYNLHGQAQAGMGVIAEDLDENGAYDLFLTHLMNEANTLYSNIGGGRGFTDVSGSSGLGPSSMRFTGFGVIALDAEFDGDLDLFIANGKVNVDQPVAGSGLPPPWNTLPEPNLLYENAGDGRFTPLAEEAGTLTSSLEISRGVASGDIDGDGDVDLLVSNLLGQARLYRNDAPRKGNWLAVRAVDPLLNRDAIGARISLLIGDRRLSRDVVMSSGYLSSQSPWVHFGIGEAGKIDHIRVRWPDGSKEQFSAGAVNQAITLRRGDGAPTDG